MRIKNLVWGHKKISLVVLVALIVVGVILWPKGGKPILTETAKIQDVIKTVSVTGSVDAQTSVNLTFQTPETLAYVGVKLGDTVKKYQIIVSLDQTQLQATFRQAQQDFVAAKAASQQYYDDHTSGTESDAQKVQRTAIDDVQNKAYDQMLKVQHDIANSSLYAPIAGIVTRMDAQTAGVNITPATVFTITDPSSLVFKMEVDEADIGQVKLGQSANVSLDAFPNDNLKFAVDKIDFISHLTTSGGNAFYAKANLPQNSSYRVGMNGNADIIVDAKYNVLSIQTTDIFDNNYVYVKTAKGYMKKKIVLGLQNDTQAQVLSGLSEGDTVAIDPTSVPQNLVVKN
ncbi:MAG TPA: efflux RND transporter periplasmic adaptor subunit [Patescibacteria group bacterium]|nr:efflux RND transporter periplasmic adaptor subunit [Patescibacteria group bacterium]